MWDFGDALTYNFELTIEAMTDTTIEMMICLSVYSKGLNGFFLEKRKQILN